MKKLSNEIVLDSFSILGRNAFPRTGLALAFGLVTGGQMFISVLPGHINVLVAQRHSINSWEIIGMIMIADGILIIRQYWL